MSLRTLCSVAPWPKEHVCTSVRFGYKERGRASWGAHPVVPACRKLPRALQSIGGEEEGCCAGPLHDLVM